MMIIDQGLGQELQISVKGVPAPVYPPLLQPQDTVTTAIATGSTALNTDTLIEAAKKEANTNPLIVVSICVGLLRLFSQR